MSAVVQHTSSLRTRTAEETLSIVRRLARDVGIVRVTDTTRLDRLGVPVYASIRPDASPGSLCVSAGKGMRAQDAEAGAYMEAFELAYADPRRANVTIQRVAAREIWDARTRGIESLIDLVPRMDAKLDLDAQLDCVEAEDVFSGERVLLPAELALFPHASKWYWSDTNGLCSGNDVLEATVHGLAEVIERDICSFFDATDTSIRIEPTSMPPPFPDLVLRTEALEVDLHVREIKSAFQLPCIVAMVRERGVRDGVHVGYGCHPWRTIALSRAVTEAFQSRLSLIHGGRDDLGAHLDKYATLSEEDRMRRFHMVVDDYPADEPRIAFSETVDRAAETATLDDSLAVLAAELRAIGLRHVFRVVLTPPSSPLTALRVIVPGLEFWKVANGRIGRRLAQHLRRGKLP